MKEIVQLLSWDYRAVNEGNSLSRSNWVLTYKTAAAFACLAFVLVLIKIGGELM